MGGKHWAGMRKQQFEEKQREKVIELVFNVLSKKESFPWHFERGKWMM